MICERRDVKGVNTQTETQRISLERKYFTHSKGKKEKKILTVCNIIVDTRLSVIRNIS